MKIIVTVLFVLSSLGFAKDHGTSKNTKGGMVVHALNCEVKGVKVMTLSKEDCTKIEGVWIEEQKSKTN